MNKWWTATRIVLSLVFLWAFFDKLLGLGFSTCRVSGEYLGMLCERAWLAGGSPTTGFLSGADGYLGAFFNGLAGSAIIDWLFMLGLLGIGIALLVGAAMGLAAYAGALMLVLMWLAELPLTTNPLIDDHLVYTLVLLAMYFSGFSGQNRLAQWWRSLGFVQKHKWLQ